MKIIKLFYLENLMKQIHIIQIHILKSMFIYQDICQETKIDDLIIAPHWSWIDKSNVVLSGVNFVKILSKNIDINYKIRAKNIDLFI